MLPTPLSPLETPCLSRRVFVSGPSTDARGWNSRHCRSKLSRAALGFPSVPNSSSSVALGADPPSLLTAPFGSGTDFPALYRAGGTETTGVQLGGEARHKPQAFSLLSEKKPPNACKTQLPAHSQNGNLTLQANPSVCSLARPAVHRASHKPKSCFPAPKRALSPCPAAPHHATRRARTSSTAPAAKGCRAARGSQHRARSPAPGCQPRRAADGDTQQAGTKGHRSPGASCPVRDESCCSRACSGRCLPSTTSCHLPLFAYRRQALSACQFFQSLLSNF